MRSSMHTATGPMGAKTFSSMTLHGLSYRPVSRLSLYTGSIMI